MKKKIYISTVSILTRISPTVASRVVYAVVMRRILHLRNPKTFSEKLMKLKLTRYNKSPNVWRCADKLYVREYAKNHGVGEKNLPKILAVYGNASEIDFDALPRKFVLKCTHGAGFNVICKDKNLLDRADTVNELNNWLKTPFGLSTAETHYGRVPPSIICEAFINSGKDKLPIDYKIYCFSGKPLYIMVCTEREGLLSRVNLFDTEWNDTHYIKPQYSSKRTVIPPKSLSLMLELAAMVSKEFPFVRVDFYEDKGVPILGEMTFTPHACINNNMTEAGQAKLGRLVDLTYLSDKVS